MGHCDLQRNHVARQIEGFCISHFTDLNVRCYSDLLLTRQLQSLHREKLTNNHLGTTIRETLEL